jgi:hypothetical protein
MHGAVQGDAIAADFDAAHAAVGAGVARFETGRK